MVHAILEKHLPPHSVAYCYGLWKKYGFTLLVKKGRKSKLGDYTFKEGKHIITLNNDLSAHAFLVTYLHEVAHLVVKVSYKRRQQPHGPQWQNAFKKLMEPMLFGDVFPAPILGALRAYMASPAASTCASPELMKALNYKEQPDNESYVDELPNGSFFTYGGRTFRKEALRRTRIAALNVADGRTYLFNAGVSVVKAAAVAMPAPIIPAHTLAKAPAGTTFTLNGRRFTKLENRRTRVLCKEAATGKNWLVNGSLPLS